MECNNMHTKIRIACKLIIYKLFSKKTWLLNDEAYNKLIFWVTFGRKADFDNPKSFNEFICARKVRQDEYDLWKYTDKYEVRKYVEEKIGKRYLNECYGVYEHFDDIDFDALPNSFALRCTHGSGCNIIVPNKEKLEKKQAKREIDHWLKQNYYYLGREKNYYKITPRIECDFYLENKVGEGLPELKIFCFGGKAKFISYNLFFNGRPLTNYYDPDWNQIDVKVGYEHFKEAKLPDERFEAIRIAEKLAEPFDFVRVDLYVVNGSILFSELTFHSGGGFTLFEPSSYDYLFAKYFMELENPV